MKTPRRSQKAGAVTARSRSLQRMVRRFGELLLVDVGGVGLVVADALETLARR